MADLFATRDRNNDPIELPTAGHIVEAIAEAETAADARHAALVDALANAGYYPATQSVSAAALPLPAGAATSTGVTAVKTSVDALVPLLNEVETLLTALGVNLASEMKLEAVRALLATISTGIAAMGSAEDMFEIVPNDAADLAQIPKGLFVTNSGTLVVRGAAGVNRTMAVGTGQIIPLRARRVMATGTTATLLGMI